MRCPYCGEDHDKVIDSRATDGAESIRRRRECLHCGKRFTTYEHVEAATRLAVIKKDGSRVPYDRRKIAAGVEAACYKRPVPSEKLIELTEEVEEELFRKGQREVRSLDIGNLVADKLKKLDQVAYVRYASVYKQFRSIDDVLAEVREIIEQRDQEPPDQGKLF